jgi:hypothetical protein
LLDKPIKDDGSFLYKMPNGTVRIWKVRCWDGQEGKSEITETGNKGDKGEEVDEDDGEFEDSEGEDEESLYGYISGTTHLEIKDSLLEDTFAADEFVSLSSQIEGLEL